jgi:hypothetical protein
MLSAVVMDGPQYPRGPPIKRTCFRGVIRLAIAAVIVARAVVAAVAVMVVVVMVVARVGMVPAVPRRVAVVVAGAAVVVARVMARRIIRAVLGLRDAGAPGRPGRERDHRGRRQELLREHWCLP